MPVLQIYIIKGECHNCRYTFEVARQLKALVPELEIELVDLGDTKVEKPAAVFAVPTYIWQGHTVSLGNPDPEWLAGLLTNSKGF